MLRPKIIREKEILPEKTIVLDPYSQNKFSLRPEKDYVILGLVDKGNRHKGITSRYAEEKGLDTMTIAPKKRINLTIDQTVNFLCKTIRIKNPERALEETLPKRWFKQHS